MFLKLYKIIKEHKELKYLAYHDSLTGLLNRNWLYKNLDNIVADFVFFIDINDLHEVNKKGHTFGDMYIKDVVASIKLIGKDLLVRYAGDEFLLFTSDIDRIKSNKNFSVGCCEMKKDVLQAINIADRNMIMEKKRKRLYF